MILTQKVQIYPSNEQEQLLWLISERCRLLYNFALTERKIIWEQEKKLPKQERQTITYTDQQNALPALKKKFPEYTCVYSKVLQMVLKTLDSDFKSFFQLWKHGDTSARPPKYKGKKYFVTLKYNQSGFKINGNYLIISHKHPLKLPLVFRLDYVPNGTVKQVELFYDAKTEKYFVSFNTEIEVPEYFDNGLYQAFDLGITNIVSAVNSQGNFLQIETKRPEKYWRPIIQELQSKRDRCKPLSKQWCIYNHKLSNSIRKLANQQRDYQHKLTSVLVNNTKANTIIIGKPSVKKMAKKNKGTTTTTTTKTKTSTANKQKNNKTLNYSLQNTGYMSRFAKWLTYKAEKIGKKVITIDEAYTTQICPKCDTIEIKSLSKRKHICSNCGLSLDRDLASSINILVKFYILKQNGQWEDLLQEPSVNEESFLQKWNGFLRQTVKGKTKVSLSSFSLIEFGEPVGSPIL